MRYWDITTFSLLIFTGAVTPYEVAFLSNDYGPLFYINRAIDFLFFCDLVISFFMGFYEPHEGIWVYDLKQIRSRYLKSWFAIDLLSIFPFGQIGTVLGSGNALSGLKLFRVIRLLRLAKLLRILRAGRIFRRLESSLTIDYSMLELLKFSVMTLVLAHWIACCFGVMKSMGSGSDTWMHYYFCDPQDACDPDDLHHTVRYGAALYWAITTITTIGFGDILPNSTEERFLVIIVMLLGAFQYGYIIGALGSILSTRDERKNRYISIMMELNAFMEEGRLPLHVRSKLREYFKYRSTAPDVRTYHNILQQLSPKLRGEVAMMLDNRWIQSVYLFEGQPAAFITEVALSLNQQTFPPYELLFEVGDIADAMYIIKKGVIAVGGTMYRKWDTLLVECLYKETRHTHRAYTVTYTDMWIIKSDEMLQILSNFPSCAKSFRRNAIRRILRREILSYATAYREMQKCAGKNRSPNITSLGSLQEHRVLFYYNKLEMIASFKTQEKSSDFRAILAIQRWWRRRRLNKPTMITSSEASVTENLIAQVKSISAQLASLQREHEQQQTEHEAAIAQLDIGLRAISNALAKNGGDDPARVPTMIMPELCQEFSSLKMDQSSMGDEPPQHDLDVHIAAFEQAADVVEN